MRIAMAQLNPTIGDFTANLSAMLDAHERACRLGAELVVFSELATTGYPPRDLLIKDGFVDANLEILARLSLATIKGAAILVGCVERNTGPGNSLFNTAALLDDGKIVARRRKMLLPTYDVFDEDRYFEPGDSNATVNWNGLRLGITICEDIWYDVGETPRHLYEQDPVEEVMATGAELIINISASPFTLKKAELRRRVIADTAKKWKTPVVYVNQVGAQDELIFDGHSMAVDADGAITSRCRDFDEDLQLIDFVTKGEDKGSIVGTLNPVSQTVEEESYRALALGVRDYMRRCGFTQAVIGLSGGIDSALTAAIAVEALGADGVLGVAMPSRYSSDGSLIDAKQLAENLGIKFRTITIEPMFQTFLQALAADFEGLPQDVTEENIQARIRSTLLMAFSNKQGRLLLTTGNKSELAVGYCTLYGDMSGGLSVISDVPKTLVFDICRWINRDHEVIPEAIVTKPPSAELREDQLDQDTLPPYPVLDAIIEAYVEDNLSISEIVALGYDSEVVRQWVEVINRNEFKRRQAAPGLRITSKAFGLGRRMPIAVKFSWQ